MVAVLTVMVVIIVMGNIIMTATTISYIPSTEVGTPHMIFHLIITTNLA